MEPPISIIPPKNSSLAANRNFELLREIIIPTNGTIKNTANKMSENIPKEMSNAEIAKPSKKAFMLSADA